jgi:hypothetical protein
VLATVLFTDIVGSTERATELGDRRWAELIIQHHALVRQQLERFRGREIGTAGDGFLAAFDGPARAVRGACAIGDAVRSLGLRIRSGLHTGECEVIGETLGGIAVHIGARVAALAKPDEVLVSSTVKDLVAGPAFVSRIGASTACAVCPGSGASLPSNEWNANAFGFYVVEVLLFVSSLLGLTCPAVSKNYPGARISRPTWPARWNGLRRHSRSGRVQTVLRRDPAGPF